MEESEFSFSYGMRGCFAGSVVKIWLHIDVNTLPLLR